MTVYINDGEVCKECGAYFESTGYCVNGHIKLVEVPLENLTLDVGMLRAKLADQRELLSDIQDRIHGSKEWQDFLTAQDMVRSTEGELTEAEAVAKIAIEIWNENTDESKGFGWQVKEFKTIEYDEAAALEWARQRPVTANLISLKKSPFEKVARALIDTGMEEAPDFVELGTEKRAQLTKELG